MRGGMLGSLQAKVINENSALIQFSNERAARLAYYHNVSGAGKSKVIRRFLGLPPRDIEELKKLVLKNMIVEIADKKIKLNS